MNIEKSIEEIKIQDLIEHIRFGTQLKYDIKDYIYSIETLLTAYEKEKEKNEKIYNFCRRELAFERRLKREKRKPDEFNQGRFYVSENIRKIIKEE